MNKNVTVFKYKFTKLFHQHQAFVVVVSALIILIIAFLRINSLSNLPADQDYLRQETSKLKTVQFNQDAISQIQALDDSNVATPGTQLPSNRQNPFNE
jgi:hypothetical protein